MRAHRPLAPYLFIAPALIVFGFAVLVPFVFTGAFSLTEWDGYSEAVFVGVDNYVRAFGDQVRAFVPHGRRCTVLGTDGYGRSDTRAHLRRFFEVDAESTVIATLYALAQKGKIEKTVVAQAIKDLDVNPEKVFPQLV